MVSDKALLSPYRVIDLCDARGALCGGILASMGADVIRVEPPGGCPSRQLAPFYGDVPDPEGSLVWWALGKNKRSLTLDLEATEGRAVFHKLLQTADFITESFEPGYLDGLGLGYTQLRQAKPSIVYVSITPYGQTGPHSRWAASDINIQAMGGHMYLTGDIERAPVRVGLPATYWHGGSEGAAGAMAAHHHRRRTGQGQHVDVSMQQCVIWTLLNTTMTWQMVRRQEMRGGTVRKERGNTVYTRIVWPCRDGLVQFIPIGGGGGESRSKAYLRFVDWAKSEGFETGLMTAKDWNNVDMYNFSQAEFDAAAEQIGAFLKTKTIDELYAKAVEHRILLAPIGSIEDLLQSPQLKARQFFVEVEHPELGRSFAYPGAFAIFSETPLEPPRRAPRLGEHTGQILGELGYGKDDLVALRERQII